MPSVTVQLIYTPRPEGESVAVREGMRVYRHGDSVFIADEGSGRYGTDQHIEVPIAEALALARALALVAGCADPLWRGFHWRAEEANGNELGETPLGQWYVNRDDCLKAVVSLFGRWSDVRLDYGDGEECARLRQADTPGDGLAELTEEQQARLIAAIAADDTPEAEQ